MTSIEYQGPDGPIVFGIHPFGTEFLDVGIFAAIDRLNATEDEKAALRFADWGDYGDEIEEDADKAAVERLAVLRAEEAENNGVDAGEMVGRLRRESLAMRFKH